MIHPLPCHPLFEEIQLTMLLIQHQLPIVQSMFKWANDTLEQRASPSSCGWMLIMDGCWTKESRYEHFIALKKTVTELKVPLKALMHRIHELALHRPIQSASLDLHISYQRLPPIEPVIHRLTLGDNLLDHKDLLTSLLSYIDGVDTLQSKAAFLKQLVLRETIKHAGHLYN